MDQFGKFFIPMEYPTLYCEGLDYMWDCTVFRIESEAGIGYVRLGDGRCLVTPHWDRLDMDRLYLSGDNEPWGHIFTAWKGGQCGLVYDDKGMIIHPEWDEIVSRRISFEDPLSYSVRRGEHWGCCDANGHLICDAIWDEVDVYQNGIACVKKDGKWGAIGADGRICVPIEWDEIEGFGIRNMADVAKAHTNSAVLLGWRPGEHLPDCFSWVRKNGLWGLIDREGTVIAAPIWETHDGVTARKSSSMRLELRVCINKQKTETLTDDEDIITEEKSGEVFDDIAYHFEIQEFDDGDFF